MSANSNNPDLRAQWAAFRADHLLNAGISLLEDAADRGATITLNPESASNVIEWLRELRDRRRRDSTTET